MYFTQHFPLKKGLEVWKEARSLNNPMDVMVPPNFQEKLELKLTEANIPHVVKISDLQTAINNENPVNTERSADDRLSTKMNFKSFCSLEARFVYIDSDEFH